MDIKEDRQKNVQLLIAVFVGLGLMCFAAAPVLEHSASILFVFATFWVAMALVLGIAEVAQRPRKK